MDQPDLYAVVVLHLVAILPELQVVEPRPATLIDSMKVGKIPKNCIRHHLTDSPLQNVSETVRASL